MAGEQISGASEPGQERGQRDQVERRDMRNMASGWRVHSATAELEMKVRQAQMRAANQENHHAQEESDHKTDQIKICPGHSRAPFLPFEGVAACGCSASSSRSASPGVSRIAPSNKKHFRVSFSRASLIKTLLSSSSPAKRSEACKSQTSRLPSVVRKSDVSSV